LTLLSDESTAKPIFETEASFEAAFKQFYTPLYRIVYPILKNKDTSEDVVQDLFVRLWNKRATISISSSLKSYLYRAAINSAFDHLEKYKREVYMGDMPLKNEPIISGSTEAYIAGKETEAYISLAMEKLPPACRTVFLMSREEEMSYQEIADSLQISIKTVENQIGKALKILRAELKPHLKDLMKIFLLCFTYL
jgi:RNA polymerase sigma-70 factor (ECF subfamily)